MKNRDTFPDQTPRDQFTAGLRQLADYLDSHPAIPVAPYGWDLLVSTHCAADPDDIAQIDRIAALLGVPVEDELADGGHYSAIKSFGPITYRAFHIPARHKAAHRALMTYADSVTPEETHGDADDPPQAA
jgi:hypothetical protein